MFKRWICASAASCFLAACATTTQGPQIALEDAIEEAHKQKVLALQMQAEREKRLGTISQALLAANAELCPRTKELYGLSAITPEDVRVPRKDRPVAKEALDLDDRPTVMWVAPGLPAESAGIREGDLVTAIDGNDIGFGKRATNRLMKILRKGGGHTFSLYRDGDLYDIEVEPTIACNYEVHLLDSPELNAYANGRAVYITKGMMSFVRSDEELALIVGHELAHNSMNHMRSKQLNSVLGALAGAAIGAAIGDVNVADGLADAGADVGAAMFSQEFEAEADYVGLYFAGRAGFQTMEAADVWRRMGMEHPSAIDLIGSSHPSTATRFLSIEEASLEFNGKQQEGRPLIPTKKGEGDDG